MIRINDNSQHAGIVRNLNLSYKNLLATMEKLSSGLRINRASDDPAGLVISEQLRSRIASLNQDIENTTLAIRKYNTADATINQLYSVLHGIRSMAVAAADGGVNNDATRDAYQSATDRAVGNYDNIIDTAAFNHRQLLDGSDGSLADIPRLGQLDLSNPEEAARSLKSIDQALAELSRAQIDIGSAQKYELEARRSNLEVTVQNLTAAESEIRDTDYALTLIEMIKNEIKVNAGVALLAHANVNRQTILSLMGS